MIVQAHAALIQRWRRRISGRRRDPDHRRPLGALGYLANGPVLDGLIDVDKLVLVVLYDEPTGGGNCRLRLAGFSGRPVPWGVEWGGPRGSRFSKDLRLEPASQARGPRINAGDTRLLELSLQLERLIQRHLRDRWLPVLKSPVLPRVWAGFRRSDAAKLFGDGPELAAVCRRRGESAQQVLESAKREYHGLVLCPLDWVSHHWQQAVATLADLSRFPRRQVFSLKTLARDLQGYRGAAAFDFSGSRIRTGSRRRRRRPRHTCARRPAAAGP